MTNISASSIWFHLTDKPLLGFACLGMLIFLLAGGLAGNDRERIEIADVAIDRLVSDRELLLDRPLTSAERERVTQDFIDQEVLVREAMKRNLYLNDGRVRHRLADKMLYLLGDDVGEPDQESLYQFYEDNKDKYVVPQRHSFEHVFYSDQGSALLDFDRNQPFSSGLGFYMGNELDEYARGELIPIFGAEFADQITELQIGLWSEPIESSRGWHRVKVNEILAPEQIPYEQLGNVLATDWRAYQLGQLRRARIDEMRSAYEIVGADGQVW